MVAVFFSFAGAVIAGELLTLEESIETALANNLQVNVSSEMVKQAEYDIVLCDIKMPDLDGIEVLEKLWIPPHSF